MTTWRMRDVGAVIAGVLLLLVVGAVVLIVRSGADPSGAPSPSSKPPGTSAGGSPSASAEPSPQIREDLLRKATPDPSCSRRSTATAPDLAKGQVRVSVLRLVGTCLVSETRVADESEVEQTLARIRTEPDVVAADRVAPALPPG